MYVCIISPCRNMRIVTVSFVHQLLRIKEAFFLNLLCKRRLSPHQFPNLGLHWLIVVQLHLLTIRRVSCNCHILKYIGLKIFVECNIVTSILNSTTAKWKLIFSPYKSDGNDMKASKQRRKLIKIEV